MGKASWTAGQLLTSYVSRVPPCVTHCHPLEHLRTWQKASPNMVESGINPSCGACLVQELILVMERA